MEHHGVFNKTDFTGQREKKLFQPVPLNLGGFFCSGSGRTGLAHKHQKSLSGNVKGGGT